MEQLFLLLPIFILAVVVHESAHAWVAFRLGDPTAKSLGRLTLNPIKHVSLVGSILVPFVLIMSHAPIFFAWAKPVPINPRFFKKPLIGMGWVALAGPVSNFLMAAVFALGYRLIALFPENHANPALTLVATVCVFGVAINVLLGVFNLIPIPPLDGGRIATALLPKSLVKIYGRLERIGFIIVVAFIYLGGFKWLILPMNIVIGFCLGKEFSL